MTNQPATDTPTPRSRSWPRILVAAALAISGASAILYAGLLPLYPFSEHPVPIVWMTFGAVELVAAVGVFLLREWGRWLAVAVIVVTLVLTGIRAAYAGAGPDLVFEIGSFLVSLIIDGLILWWLLRRWPGEPSRR